MTTNEAPRPAIRRVWPTPSTPFDPTSATSATEVIAAAYRVVRPRPSDRPWVALTMIAAVDGATHVGGNSKGLGNPNDATVLVTMRTACDVVLVGSTTAVADNYGPPSKPGQRIGVVTRTIDIDLTTPLFTSGAGFLVTTDGATLPAGAGAVDVVRCGRDEIDFGRALAEIDQLVGGADTVHLEGGPTLNGLMLDAGLVDEMNFTTAPFAVGGSSSRVINHAQADRRPVALAHQLIDDDGYVFSRWLLNR